MKWLKKKIVENARFAEKKSANKIAKAMMVCVGSAGMTG